MSFDTFAIKNPNNNFKESGGYYLKIFDSADFCTICLVESLIPNYLYSTDWLCPLDQTDSVIATNAFLGGHNLINLRMLMMMMMKKMMMMMMMMVTMMMKMMTMMKMMNMMMTK